MLTILKSREQHVAKMMALYQERAVLARQAAEMAMRSATAGTGTSGMPGNDDNSNMCVLMRHGYLYCARSLVAVHRVLECVKVSEPSGILFPLRHLGQIFPRATSVWHITRITMGTRSP